MAAKLTRLTHIIEVQLHLVAESCTICISRSRRPVRKLLVTPSYLHAFVSSALDGGERSVSRPGRFAHGVVTPDTNRIGGWVGPRTGLNRATNRKIPGPRRESNPDRPDRSVRSQSLYRLSYPSSFTEAPYNEFKSKFVD
jgi:hypothetical protein